MRTAAVLAVLALAAGGCSRGERPAPGPVRVTQPERITYETGPCMGACPVYRLTIQPDGAGMFTGIRHTAQTGNFAIAATPAQARAFAAALAPYRPARGDRRIVPGSPECGQAATDMPSVTIRWSGGAAGDQRLEYYRGCDMAANAAMAEALAGAPARLPIAALIGQAQ